jgi:hypothetical protein
LQQSNARGGDRISCPKCGAVLEVPRTAALVVEASQAPPIRQPGSRPQHVAVQDDRVVDPEPEPGLSEQPSDQEEIDFRPPGSRAAWWFFLGVCVGAFPTLAVLLYVILAMPRAEAPGADPQHVRGLRQQTSDSAPANLAPRPADTGSERVEIERIPPSHQFIPPGLRQTGAAAARQGPAADATQKKSKEEEYEAPRRPLRRVPVDDGNPDDDAVRIPARKDSSKNR